MENHTNLISTQGTILNQERATLLLDVYRNPGLQAPSSDLRALERDGLIVCGWLLGGKTGHSTTIAGDLAVVDALRGGMDR